MYWANDKKNGTVASPYTGTAYELLDADVACLDAAGYPEEQMAVTVIIQYSDCSAEFLNLANLTYRACPCTEHCSQCAGTKQTTEPARHHRVAWVLQEHNSAELLAKRLCLEARSKTKQPTKTKRKRKRSRVAKQPRAQVVAASGNDSSSGDDETTADVLAKRQVVAAIKPMP